MPYNIYQGEILITQEQLPVMAITAMHETHVEEIEIINKLDTAARNNEVDAVSLLLTELYEHTAMHFYDEEDLMEDAIFPALKMHKNEHDTQLRELKALLKHFEEHKDTKVIYTYIEDTLTPWILHHANTVDMTTAIYLKPGSTTSCSATKGCTTGDC